MPDPKLKVAMEEIKAVLKRHDIAAVVVLSSQTHMEFLYAVAPTWSCATLSSEGCLRVRALRAEFPSHAAHQKCVQDTVGMVAGFMDSCNKAASNMTDVLIMLGHHIDIDHRTTDE